MINIPYEDATLFPEPENNWKTPASLALAVHLLVLSLTLLPATLFEPNLNLEEIYTVDLFEVLDNGDVRKVNPTVPVQVKKPVKQSPPPLVEKTVVAEKPESQVVSTAEQPGEVISLAPRLRKKDLREKKIAAQKEEKKLADALAKIKARLHRQQTAAEAKKARALAAVAVNDALAQLRASIHSSDQVASSKTDVVGTGSDAGAGRGQGQVMDAALKQYYIAVSRHIHQFWILPELQEWPKNLTAVYVVHVRRDGIVNKNYFETKSKDYYFNQFVEKTMKEALPLPPFPKALKEKELEIGLVFHPSGLE